jgi:hypothetical protein
MIADEVEILRFQVASVIQRTHRTSCILQCQSDTPPVPIACKHENQDHPAVQGTSDQTARLWNLEVNDE